MIIPSSTTITKKYIPPATHLSTALFIMTVDDCHLIRVTVDIVVKGVDIIPIDRDEVDVADANRKCIKEICNSCGMVNHHIDSCHFLMKLSIRPSFI